MEGSALIICILEVNHRHLKHTNLFKGLLNSPDRKKVAYRYTKNVQLYSSNDSARHHVIQCYTNHPHGVRIPWFTKLRPRFWLLLCKSPEAVHISPALL